jgi:excinuclease UvrABC nuclease subunit
VAKYMFYKNWKCVNTYDTNFAEAPNKSGVYAITECDLTNISEYNPQLVYIGSSLNLKKRHRTHNIISEIQNKGLFAAFYFIEMSESFYDFEIKLIREHQPKYNKNKYNG